MLDEDGRRVRDVRRVVRLSETLWRHMHERQSSFLAKHSRTPILLHYQSDATSFLTMGRKQLGSQAGSGTHRSFHDLCDLLSERVFMAAGRGLAVGASEVISTCSFASTWKGCSKSHHRLARFCGLAIFVWSNTEYRG